MYTSKTYLWLKTRIRGYGARSSASGFCGVVWSRARKCRFRRKSRAKSSASAVCGVFRYAEEGEVAESGRL